MQVARFSPVFLSLWLAAALAACGSSSSFSTTNCSKVTSTHCVEIAGGDSAALLSAVNSIDADTTLVLGGGTFKLTNEVTVRTKGAHLIGQGVDKTTLDFGSATAQINGVIATTADDFLIQDLTVVDSPKDGIRVEDTKGVVYRRIRVTWSRGAQTSNGAYGIYPVRSQNVLVEDSSAEYASDAGLYVGQCEHVIIRNNTVSNNVAGLEIENTQYADVHDNTAENNTGGIVVFDLPGNPIVGRDVRLHDNIIRNNNHVNFAVQNTGTVRLIPAGTGTFALASRRVEITGNTYENNNTGDIAILSGLVITFDASKPDADPTLPWVLQTKDLRGNNDGLSLDSAGDGAIVNYRTQNILIANNKHSGSGTSPDTRPSEPAQLGVLLAVKYAGMPVDSVLYDSIGESMFDSSDPSKNINGNHVCVGGNTAGTFASMSLLTQLTEPTTAPAFYRPAAPFTPFDCTALDGGPVAEVTLP